MAYKIPKKFFVRFAPNFRLSYRKFDEDHEKLSFIALRLLLFEL